MRLGLTYIEGTGNFRLSRPVIYCAFDLEPTPPKVTLCLWDAISPLKAFCLFYCMSECINLGISYVYITVGQQR